MTSLLTHDALFYSSEAEYVGAIREFAVAGLALDETPMILVPRAKLDLLRHDLGRDLVAEAELVDMSRVGRNPARVISLIETFLGSRAQQGGRLVDEPIWPGRTPAEITEAIRHEALLNAAFAEAPLHILCPYGTSTLDHTVLDEAKRTHPTCVCGNQRYHNSSYLDPFLVYRATDRPLSAPTTPPHELSLEHGRLGLFRRQVEEIGRSAGLETDRTSDLVLAAHEAAANTFVHGGRDGTARMWDDGRDLICEISDSGTIDDPLIGRRTPATDDERGRGLWMINQLCDLVELRSDDNGTILRLHMRLEGHRTAGG